MTEDRLLMSEGWQERTERLIDQEAMQRLTRARVLVAGVGGVGGYAAEMLARSGVGHLTVVDADNVAPSNINRQIIALHSTVGQPKTALFAARFRDINPDILVDARQEYITPDNVPELLDGHYDYVIDAIDTVAPKMALICHCLEHRIPVISSMGAGGRIDPTQVGYFDISQTRNDGLARVVRQRLRKMGINRGLKVVASTEVPHSRALISLDEPNKKSSFGTLASIPSIFGIFLANHVITTIACLK